MSKQNEKLRNTYIFRNDEWVLAEFSSLKKGEKFKLEEPDGEMVEALGTTLFLAETDAYLNDENVWAVSVMAIKDNEEV